MLKTAINQRQALFFFCAACPRRPAPQVQRRIAGHGTQDVGAADEAAQVAQVVGHGQAGQAGVQQHMGHAAQVGVLGHGGHGRQHGLGHRALGQGDGIAQRAGLGQQRQRRHVRAQQQAHHALLGIQHRGLGNLLAGQHLPGLLHRQLGRHGDRAARHHVAYQVQALALFLGALFGPQVGRHGTLGADRQVVQQVRVACLGFLRLDPAAAGAQAAGALHTAHGRNLAEAIGAPLVHGAVDAENIKHLPISLYVCGGLSSLSAHQPATEQQLPHNGGCTAALASRSGPPH